jgi:hypothetical protein
VSHLYWQRGVYPNGQSRIQTARGLVVLSIAPTSEHVVPHISGLLQDSSVGSFLSLTVILQSFPLLTPKYLGFGPGKTRRALQSIQTQERLAFST